MASHEEELGRNVKVVFLGPCIAKKKNPGDPRHDTYIDAVLNFNDINKWLEEEDIVIEDETSPLQHLTQGQPPLSRDQRRGELHIGHRGERAMATGNFMSMEWPTVLICARACPGVRSRAVY